MIDLKVQQASMVQGWLTDGNALPLWTFLEAKISKVIKKEKAATIIVPISNVGQYLDFNLPLQPLNQYKQVKGQYHFL